MKRTLLSLLICIQICIQTSIATETRIVVRIKQQHTPSAVGICWRNDNHIIYYVDLNSDLYNRVYPGDIVLSQNGMSPEQFRNQGYFLDGLNTPVQVIISRSGRQLSFTALRHPVSQMSATWHQGCKY